MARNKEVWIALVIYLITMGVLLMAVYQFLESWHLSDFNFFVAGALVLLVAVGWGYVLITMLFAPKKQLEKSVTTIVDEILHELNIPLSTIEANTSMLKKSLLDVKSLKRLGRIEDASVRLKRLYDELSYTLHKEIHSIEKETFDIKVLVEERVVHFEQQQRNVFILKLESVMITADKIGFEQMIDNIIDNAMKYSAKEEPINITLDQNHVSISDKGTGMSTGELLRIYERYFQGDTSKSGQGIGLALVKAYCDAEDFTIDIHSEKERGTQVSIHWVHK